MADLSEQELQALRAIHEMPEGLKKEQLIAELAKRFKVSRKVIRLELARLVDDDEAKAEEAVPPQELVTQSWSILMEADQLAALRRSLSLLGYAGATEPVEILWLALASRVLPRPINVAVRGASAAGKTFSVDTAKRYHPRRALHDLTGTSERGLVYSKFNTRHAYVLIAEASAIYREGIGASIVRSLSWGEGIKYETVLKGPNGLEAVVIEKEGPTGLIVTSVRDLEEEISTRMLQVHVNESPEQTRAIVREHARTDSGEAERTVDLSAWIAASEWLAVEGETRVIVPYAPQIADAVPNEDVRIRRDYDQLISLIKVHALVHQWRRPRMKDGVLIPVPRSTGSTALTTDVAPPEGAIVATEEDYRAAHRLLGQAMAITLDDVSDTARETVTAVGSLVAAHVEGVSYAALGTALGITREAARKRARAPLKAGYLVNAEDRKHHPARLQLGDALPAARPILPDPDTLFSVEVDGETDEIGLTGWTRADNPIGDSDLDGQPTRQGDVNRQPDRQGDVNREMDRVTTLFRSDLDDPVNPSTPEPDADARPLEDWI